MKCQGCGKYIEFGKSYGSFIKLWKCWCKECWWEKRGITEEDFMGLDEVNEIKIKELTKRIEKLELRNLNQGGKNGKNN